MLPLSLPVNLRGYYKLPSEATAERGQVPYRGKGKYRYRQIGAGSQVKHLIEREKSGKVR